MEVFNMILLGFLVVCAVSVSFSKNLLNGVPLRHIGQEGRMLFFARAYAFRYQHPYGEHHFTCSTTRL